MSSIVESIEEFAKTVFLILKSDRDVVMAICGFTGEGKSTFSTKLQKAYAKVSGTPWDFSRMTWDREELLGWIDGVGVERKNQVSEYSALLPDELISMFYRRNWYEDNQKAAIELFNKCRDRHLFIAGNVPNFWDLDSGFTNRIRFYAYIPKRGIAWIFQQENNPFVKDPWNLTENKKVFRKNRSPYKCPNFICQINFEDWDPDEKTDYYKIRNSKRLNTENQNKKKGGIRYKTVQDQRNKYILHLLENTKSTQKDIAKVGGVHPSMINRLANGEIEVYEE